MELCNSALFLVAIGLGWAILLFISFRKISNKQEKGDSRMLFSGFLMFIGLALVFIAGATAFELMESPEFCGELCHVMEPYYESYEKPVNNTFMAAHSENDISCANCHNELGIAGTAGGLASGLAETYIYVTGTYDEEHLGEYGSRDACLKCHDGTVIINGKTAIIPKNVIDATGNFTDPHQDETECVDCHTSHTKGIGLTKEACLGCHGTDLNDFPNFSENIELHGIRTFEFLKQKELNEDCMACHDREHDHKVTDTPNERIPFSYNTALIDTDFCSDCHNDEYTAYNSSYTPAAKEIYAVEGCINCHSEHKLIADPPHTSTSPYDNCDSCHGNLLEKTIHDRREVSFANISFIEQDFCVGCHDDENTAYISSITPASKAIYGDEGCFNCHTDHVADSIDPPHKITAPFANCASCHTDYPNVNIHDRTEISFLNKTDIENNFCGSCHEPETERLALANHSKRDCIDCHGDHEIRVVDFDECRICHDIVDPVIPASHDPTKDCSNCHDTTKIHSET